VPLQETAWVGHVNHSTSCEPSCAARQGDVRAAAAGVAGACADLVRRAALEGARGDALRRCAGLAMERCAAAERAPPDDRTALARVFMQARRASDGSPVRSPLHARGAAPWDEGVRACTMGLAHAGPASQAHPCLRACATCAPRPPYGACMRRLAGVIIPVSAWVPACSLSTPFGGCP